METTAEQEETIATIAAAEPLLPQQQPQQQQQPQRRDFLGSGVMTTASGSLTPEGIAVCASIWYCAAFPTLVTGHTPVLTHIKSRTHKNKIPFRPSLSHAFLGKHASILSHSLWLVSHSFSSLLSSLSFSFSLSLKKKTHAHIHKRSLSRYSP